jgi:Fe-S-cluster containining protein
MDMVPMNRCTGHCCVRFPLPFSPEGLKTALDDTRAGKADWQDIEVVQPMVIPFGPSVIDGATEKGARDWGKWWDYTCKHLDTVTGDCHIYDQRPEMCRKHGQFYPCATPGCTWEGAKRDLVNEKAAPK